MASLDFKQNHLGTDSSSPSTLPNLLIPGSAKNSAHKFDSSTLTPNKSNESISNGIEFMMLKRLNFLRNSLDGHDPEQTTAKLRKFATKMRDERIKELWKNELNAPTVQ